MRANPRTFLSLLLQTHCGLVAVSCTFGIDLFLDRRALLVCLVRANPRTFSSLSLQTRCGLVTVSRTFGIDPFLVLRVNPHKVFLDRRALLVCLVRENPRTFPLLSLQTRCGLVAVSCTFGIDPFLVLGVNPHKVFLDRRSLLVCLVRANPRTFSSLSLQMRCGLVAVSRTFVDPFLVLAVNPCTISLDRHALVVCLVVAIFCLVVVI